MEPGICRCEINALEIAWEIGLKSAEKDFEHLKKYY
jgi:hypothetical protein